MHINGFQFAKIPYFLIYSIITKYAFVLRSLSKKFINGCRILIASVTPKNAEMMPFWEKGGILHFSYLLNKSGDPNFFLHCVYHEIQPWEV